MLGNLANGTWSSLYLLFARRSANRCRFAWFSSYPNFWNHSRWKWTYFGSSHSLLFCKEPMVFQLVNYLPGWGVTKKRGIRSFRCTSWTLKISCWRCGARGRTSFTRPRIFDLFGLMVQKICVQRFVISFRNNLSWQNFEITRPCFFVGNVWAKVDVGIFR